MRGLSMGRPVSESTTRTVTTVGRSRSVGGSVTGAGSGPASGAAPSGGGADLMARLREYRHIAMWIHAARAETAGSIHRGPGGKPVVRYSLNSADMLRFREGIHIVARMHVEAGAKALLPGIFGMPYRLEPNEIDKLKDAPLDPRAYVAVLTHLFGGAVMGADPAHSIVDGRGKVHDSEGLYVVDAAVIPTNLGVNPQHTIMGLAMHFAEQLC